MTTTTRPTMLLSDVEWAAARFIAGDLPDWELSADAAALVEQVTAVAGRTVMADIAEHLDTLHTPSGRSGPRVSDYGTCGRAVWYRERPPTGYTPLPDTARGPATLGQIIHRAGAAARATRYPWRRYELQVDVPGLDRPGYVDEYDPIVGRVTDNKTAGEWRWDQVGADGPTVDAWGQVLIYGHALDDAGYPVREIEIIVINRDTGAEESFVRPYDPIEAAAALAELVDLATALDVGAVPPRAGIGPTVDHQCRRCPARDHCWNRIQAEAAGRSPESYTVLGATPSDPSIEWAGRQRIEALAAAAAAKKAAEAAAVLLQGIPEGAYGDVEIVTKWSTSVAWKPHAEQLASLYELPEAYRPPLADVGTPPKTRTRRTEAQPVRAAKRGKGPNAG